MNFILGDNGEGKTNILEGISYICLSRSFFAANDEIVVKVGESGFNATGSVLSDGDIEYEIRLGIKELRTIHKRQMAYTIHPHAGSAVIGKR